MPRVREPKNEIKRKKEPNPIFLRKAERDPKITAWIKWHRCVRRGLLTENELHEIKRKIILNPKERLAVHFTDFNFLDLILRNGLSKGSNEVSLSLFEQFVGIGGRSLSYAHDGYKKAMTQLGFSDENMWAWRNRSDGYTWNSHTIGPFNDLPKALKEYFSVFKTIIETNPEIEKRMDRKVFTSEELGVLRRYYARYKKGDLSFLEDPKQVEELKEIIIRTLARRNYFSLSGSSSKKNLASSMGVGLIYDPERTHYSFGDDYVTAGTKPIGIYLINAKLLPQILEIMLRNAKSIRDIIPIYTIERDGPSLWPPPKVLWPS